MRIAVEVVPYALPFRRPYATARGTLARREMALLRLRDEDGLTGIGEAVPLSLRGGTELGRVVEELELFERLEAIEEAELDGAGFLSAPARCAVATALLDLRQRRAAIAGDGPAGRSPVRCNATLVAGTPSEVARDAEEWAAAGFSTFKLKLGAGDDVGQVRAVREALGPVPRIRVDANAAWDVETAKRVLGELESLDVELAEQPVASLEEAAELARSTSIPLAGDESIESRADAERALDAGAFALASVKLSKVGGPEAATEIAAAIPSYLSSALDGPAGIAAAASVAQGLDAGATTPGLAHGLATQRLFASSVAASGPELQGDLLRLPDGPGLGVEIDEAALEAHRL